MDIFQCAGVYLLVIATGYTAYGPARFGDHDYARNVAVAVGAGLILFSAARHDPEIAQPPVQQRMENVRTRFQIDQPDTSRGPLRRRVAAMRSQQYHP